MLTTNQILMDGPKNFVCRVTGIQDGTGLQETLVKKIDVTTMSPPAGPSFKIREVLFIVLGGIVQVFWEAPIPRAIGALQLADHRNMNRFGGQSTLGLAGATGSVLISTLGFDVGSSYDITFECIKGI